MNTTTTKRPVATWKKITATGAILLGVGALATGGAFAIFSSSGTASLAANAGSIKIVMSNSFTVNDLAPGDQVQRLLPITLPSSNTGQLVSDVQFSYDVTSDTLGTTDTTTGLKTGQSLVTGVSGLTYRILTCSSSAGWTTVSSPTILSGAFYCDPLKLKVTSSGKLSDIVSTATPLMLVPTDFGLTATANKTFATGGSDLVLNTLIELTLPQAADNNYQNAATTLTFTAAAIQRQGMQQ